ncbi:MAG: hypothetical protein RR710_01770 [Oscillospiraceae bacterium]
MKRDVNMIKRIKNILKNKDGSALIYVLVFIVVIMVLTTAALARNKQLYNAVGIQQLNTRAYYLSKEVASVAKASLIGKDGKVRPLDTIGELNKTQNYDHTRTIDGEVTLLGRTAYKLVQKTINSEEWAVVYLKTILPGGNAVNTNTTGNSAKEFVMYYEFRINIDKPFIQVFDILTEDKTL